MKNSTTYLSTDPEVLFRWFLEQVPNLATEDLPTLRAGCVYLATFNEICEMDLDLTVKDREVDRLNPILRHQKSCFDSWMVVARRFGLTIVDKPKRIANTGLGSNYPVITYEPSGKPIKPRVTLRGGPFKYMRILEQYENELAEWEKKNQKDENSSTRSKGVA